ncbi:MAG: leucine-rich repeat domain-containing protein [Oscillospiraceae bacterium]|nr:leucine-rich repeat domain-containing protein [Oscillospiraceae bacterium]
MDTLASDPVYSDYVTTRKGTLDESIINNNPAYQVKANNDPALVYDGYEYELVKAPAAVPDGYTMRYGARGDGGAIAWSSGLPAASNAGSYEVYVKYAGDADHDDLVLTDPIAVTIAPRNINDANMTVSFDRTSFTYNGQLQGPSVTVRDEYTDLARNIDYELQESPTAADVGDYTVKVVGKGNYTGEKSQDYSITKYMLADGDKLTASFSEHAFTYNGYDQHPIPDTTIVMLNNDVVPAEYCAWEYSEGSDGSIDAGVYSVQITLYKNYGGSRPVMYTIAPKSIEDADVTKTFAGTEFIYSGAEQGPAVSVHYGGIRLHEGTDYTVENQKNTDTGTYTAKITGTGNYTGVVIQTYEIKPCNTDSGGKIIVTFPDNNKDSFPYSGEVQKPEASGIVVKLNNTTLTADDYSISYSDPDSRNAGAYWVTVTLSDNYGGKLTQKAYTITAQTLSTITGSPLAFTYNGDPQGPETIVVTGSDNKTLTGDIDYYTPLDMTATDAGDYNLIAAGKGNYEGTVSLEYIIRKADPALTAPTARALSYTGSAQKLVIAGESSDGEMLYAVTAENEAPPDFRQYTASIPTGTDAGRYHVWYMVKGDQNHNDSSAQKLEVIILPIPGTPDFTLPAAIRTIEESAFEGAAMTVVDIPDGCESIGANAFKDCANLTQIHIPAGCAIGDGAFFGCGTVYIFAPAGSPAESFCAAPANANCVFCETAD